MTTENTDDFEKAFGDAAKAAETAVQGGGASAAEPEKKEAPAEPEKKEVPAEPEKKETPAEPEKKETSAEPEKKETPAEPEKPTEPAPAQPAPAAQPAAAAAAPAAAAQPAPAVAPQETPEQKKQREEFEAMLAPYEFSEEEKSALEAMKKDFPSEYKVLAAHLKQVDRDINKRVFTAVQSVLQQVYGDFGPVAASANENSMDRHFAAVRAAHSDYETVVGKVPEWIKTQPPYLQATMQRVYDEGTTQEVIELLASYKAATGTTTPPAASSPAVPAKPAVKDAADLAPVQEKRSSPVPKGAPDMNDFEGAFAEAAGKK